MGVSKHLGTRQLRGIEKAGDILIPGDGEFPRFSATGAVRAIDRILDFMPLGDLGDLKMLLTVLGWMPGFLVGWLLRFLERAPDMSDGGLGPILRMVRLGVRGLVMSLYYGDPEVLKKLGYDVKVYTGDLAASAGAAARTVSAPTSSNHLTI
jgi:hypothetical protein